MNESQVLSSLIEFYRQQGVDLHHVLDDPVFQSLKLQEKVNALKEHAAEIVAGTHPGFNKSDRQLLAARALRYGLQGGIAGATAGAALGAVARGAKPYIPALLGAVTGISAGLAGGLIESRQNAAQRKAVYAQLRALSKSPTDANAIGVLSTKGVYGLQNTLRQEAYAALRENAANAVSQDRIRNTIERHLSLLNSPAGSAVASA